MKQRRRHIKRLLFYLTFNRLSSRFRSFIDQITHVSCVNDVYPLHKLQMFLVQIINVYDMRTSVVLLSHVCESASS